MIEPTFHILILLVVVGLLLIILGVAGLIANRLYPVNKPMATYKQNKYNSDTSLTGSIDHE